MALALERNIELKGNIVSTLCLDGADHSVIKRNDTSVISYNAQMFGEFIQKMIIPASSFNILTYQQVKAQEKLRYILLAIEDRWTALKELRRTHHKILDNCEIFFFEIDDVKFLYILTQHLL